jgi:(R)-2-hydroxyacyl-CoA dehydratese activating ATPase
MICAGVDAGSRAIKALLYDAGRQRVLGTAIADQGVDQARLARGVFERMLNEAGVADGAVTATVATGYGRAAVRFANTTITEITCHARGVHHLAPDVRTVIEIGGQDSKVIWLESAGRVRDFAMNDRCAAGTGRFLEVVASRLEVDLAQFGALCRQSVKPALISNTCVVFAETEIIGLLAEGAAVPDIAAGVQDAIVSRVIAMAGRLVQEPVYFTGGVALLEGMGRALENALGVPARIAPMPQYTGALGAAILAAESAGPRPTA